MGLARPDTARTLFPSAAPPTKAAPSAYLLPSLGPSFLSLRHKKEHFLKQIAEEDQPGLFQEL